MPNEEDSKKFEKALAKMSMHLQMRHEQEETARKALEEQQNENDKWAKKERKANKKERKNSESNKKSLTKLAAGRAKEATKEKLGGVVKDIKENLKPRNIIQNIGLLTGTPLVSMVGEKLGDFTDFYSSLKDEQDQDAPQVVPEAPNDDPNKSLVGDLKDLNTEGFVMLDDSIDALKDLNTEGFVMLDDSISDIDRGNDNNLDTISDSIDELSGIEIEKFFSLTESLKDIRIVTENGFKTLDESILTLGDLLLDIDLSGEKGDFSLLNELENSNIDGFLMLADSISDLDTTQKDIFKRSTEDSFLNEQIETSKVERDERRNELLKEILDRDGGMFPVGKEVEDDSFMDLDLSDMLKNLIIAGIGGIGATKLGAIGTSLASTLTSALGTVKAGASKVALPALGVAAAGAIGFEIGTLINDKIIDPLVQNIYDEIDKKRFEIIERQMGQIGGIAEQFKTTENTEEKAAASALLTQAAVIQSLSPDFVAKIPGYGGYTERGFERDDLALIEEAQISAMEDNIDIYLRFGKDELKDLRKEFAETEAAKPVFVGGEVEKIGINLERSFRGYLETVGGGGQDFTSEQLAEAYGFEPLENNFSALVPANVNTNIGAMEKEVLLDRQEITNQTQNTTNDTTVNNINSSNSSVLLPSDMSTTTDDPTYRVLGQE